MGSNPLTPYFKMCENKNNIKNLLKENKRGLTIQDISDQTKLSRNTVMIILANLTGENKIEVREVGQAKLHYWKK